MSGDTRSPWTGRERDALNEVLHDYDGRLRKLEIENAVLKTKIALLSGVFGIFGAALAEGVKLLLHH